MNIDKKWVEKNEPENLLAFELAQFCFNMKEKSFSKRKQKIEDKLFEYGFNHVKSQLSS